MNQKEIKKGKEFKSLWKLCKTLPKDSQVIAEKLCLRLAFIAQTLDKLEAEIAEKGPVTTGVNGNGFKVTTEAAAQKSYNNMVKNWTAMIKLLSSFFGAGEPEADELETFLKDRK